MKRFIGLVLILAFVGVSISQTAEPGRTPRWDTMKSWIKDGQYTMTYKTLSSPTISGTATVTATVNASGVITSSNTLKVVGNSTSANLYVVSEGDSFKVRMYKYLYPLEIEIGNSTKFTVDSAGNAVFAGTVSASAFSPTATNVITGHSLYMTNDLDTVYIVPHDSLYMFRIGVGGAKKFAVDSTGLVYGPNGGTVSNVTNNQWILAENSEDLNFAFAANAVNVTSSTGVNNVNFGILDLKTDRLSTVADGDSVLINPYKDLHLIEANVGSALKFGVDSTGLIIGPNEGTLSNVTNSQWILAENSEDLNFAFAADAVNVTSSTAVNNVNFGILDVKSDRVSTVADLDSVVLNPYKDLHLIDAQVGGVSMFNVDSTGILTAAGAVNGASASFTGAMGSKNVSTVADGDSVWLNPYKDTYPIKVGVGGVKMFAVDSAGIGYFAGDLSAIGGDVTGAAGNFVDIGEAADGTITFGRDDSGVVTLTSVDNDANAALTVSAGGSGALIIGDSGSTSALTSSDWAIDATGVATNFASLKFDAGDASVSSIDTTKSAGGTVKWAIFTINGVSFAAIAAADTARIVD